MPSIFSLSMFDIYTRYLKYSDFRDLCHISVTSLYRNIYFRVIDVHPILWQNWSHSVQMHDEFFVTSTVASFVRLHTCICSDKSARVNLDDCLLRPESPVNRSPLVCLLPNCFWSQPPRISVPSNCLLS